MLTLYPHQEKATQATFDYFVDHDGSPLIVAPVAAGKALLIAEFIKRACEYYPTTNFMVLSHVTELLTQDAEHLYEQWPLANTSFYAQKLGHKSFEGQVIFASINSVYKKAYKIPHVIDIVMIDEAHLISPNANTMYRTFLDDLKKINPDLKIIGYTGTNFRATEGKLTEGENRLFTDVAYQIPMLYLIEKGFLCPLVTPDVTTKMDISGVRTQNGDYVEKQLQAAVDKDHITRACVDELMTHGADKKKWLVFTAGVEHCEHVRDEIRKRGISCEMVLGETSIIERKRIVDEYKNGDLRCLVNVGCFTTGFNNPSIDLMAFMRPTRSRVLYVQMGGRGMRISPGKTDCTLLDFGGVIKELGPIDMVDAYKASGGSGNGEAPVKLCPQCHAVCFAGASGCHDCGYMFPVNPLDLSKKASNLAVMSNQIEPEWHDVISVKYTKHSKVGKEPSMCVTYNTLDGPYREWVCYQHKGYAREKACIWHSRRCDNVVTPSTIEEALKNKFLEPTRISTRQSGKFHEIVGFDFSPKIEKEPEEWKEPTTGYFRRMEGLEPLPISESLEDCEEIPF